MRNKPLKHFLYLVLFVTSAYVVQAQGTAFSYQGRLIDGGTPANGSYDLQIVLFDAASAGNPVAGTNTLAPVAVSNGLFSVTLDFGAAAFDGSARWLQLAVRTNGSAASYVLLAPRQPVIPTPYAIRAANAGLLNGQGPTAFAPATGSTQYVAKAGDTMTGTLNLPANGLAAGGSQFVLSGGNVGIGVLSPVSRLDVSAPANDVMSVANALPTGAGTTREAGSFWELNSVFQLALGSRPP